MCERTIILIDMDCFYVQVETRDQPHLRGTPVAVVQYNDWRGGGIIAVSYEARARGVKRNGMRGDDAKQICPEITLVRAPVQRDKADLTKYRNASEEVFNAMRMYRMGEIIVERASVDEAYLDVTDLVQKMISEDITISDLPTTHVLSQGHDRKDYDRETILKDFYEQAKLDQSKRKLLIAARISEEIRQKILDVTEFHCSAGIAWNKTLAKLICSKHKPREQTILDRQYLPTLYETTKISSVRNLGGRTGEHLMKQLNVSTMDELARVSKEDLQLVLNNPKSFNWITNLLKGIDSEEVKERDLTKSIAASKNFFGKSSLNSTVELHNRLERLCDEVAERYAHDREKNERMARTLTVGIRTANEDHGGSRRTPLLDNTAEYMYREAKMLLAEFNKAKCKDEWYPPATNLYVSVSNFTNKGQNQCHNGKTNRLTITHFMKKKEIQNAENSDNSAIPSTSAEPQNEEIRGKSPNIFIENESESDISFETRMEILDALLTNDEEEKELPGEPTANKPELKAEIEEIQSSASGVKENVKKRRFSIFNLPEREEEIDREILNNLPINLQREIKNHYKIKKKPDEEKSSVSKKKMKKIDRSAKVDDGKKVWKITDFLKKR